MRVENGGRSYGLRCKRAGGGNVQFTIFVRNNFSGGNLKRRAILAEKAPDSLDRAFRKMQPGLTPMTPHSMASAARKIRPHRGEGYLNGAAVSALDI